MDLSEYPDREPPFDPTFLHARKEAWYILMAWGVFLLWTVGLSAVLGYPEPGTTAALLFGIPSWVFWGVLLPWLAATVFSIWFGLFYMVEDDLGESESA